MRKLAVFGSRCQGECFLLIAGMLSLVPRPVSEHDQSDEMAGFVRGRVEALRSGIEVRAGGDRLLAAHALPVFYEAREFRPVWIPPADDGRLLVDLDSAIRGAAVHGLDPKDYHLDALDSLRQLIAGGAVSPVELIDLELLASDAFMSLGSHLLHGRVNPETLNPEWLANRRSAALDEVLAQAIGTRAIIATLMGLAPRQPRYRRMLAAAIQLRTVSDHGGWPVVPDGPPLEIGAEDARLPALRARLRAGGDLAAGAPDGAVVDQAVIDALRSFQARYGLDVDGVLGSATRAALNVPAAARVRQIEINLERWRWLPEDLGERHIEVNVAGYDVKVVEHGRPVRQHRAVVGLRYRQTPMFSGVMTYLVLSPYWHVPPSIAAADKLPAIRNDPGAISAQRMTLFDQVTNQPVDPSGVSWSDMTGAEFNSRYRLRQAPGPANALGAVKFMFPNPHNVYLHDTPSRELFGRSSRSFSSGCIRIDEAVELAVYLLADQPEWTRDRIAATIAAGVERAVRLTGGVPVHLLYWTAWADEDGALHFRDDIYGRDRAVGAGLDASPPGI